MNSGFWMGADHIGQANYTQAFVRGWIKRREAEIVVKVRGLRGGSICTLDISRKRGDRDVS